MNTRTNKDFITLPWKNGGGSTLELLKIPSTKNPASFFLKLSIATIKNPGPFSQFAGIDRHLCLLTGTGVKLHFADQTQILLGEKNNFIHFKGEEIVEAELLEGPITDFNVMIDRSWGFAEILVLRAGPGKKILIHKKSKLFIYYTDQHILTEICDSAHEVNLPNHENIFIIHVGLF